MSAKMRKNISIDDQLYNKVMNDPELKARYDEYVAELIDEEKMITELKRLLFKAMPYIRADADYGGCRGVNDSRQLLDEINEALR